MGKIDKFTPPSSAAPNTSFAAFCATSCTMPCAAFFTCSSFTCRPRANLVPQTPERAEDLKKF